MAGNRRLFELEQLEQRIMLSADHLAVGVAEEGVRDDAPEPTEIVIEAERLEGSVPEAVDDPFAGLTEVSAQTPSLSLDFNASDDESRQRFPL